MKVTLVCKQCSATFEKRKAEYNRQLKKGRHYFFCSLSCSAAHGNAAKTAFIARKSCRYCGVTFETKQDRHEAVFCSRRCASLGSVTSYRRATAQITGQNNSSNLSNSKALFSRESKKYSLLIPMLVAKQIRYNFEKMIGKFIFDLALEDQNVLVEFDGPEHRTPKGIERDTARDRFAEALGWTVLRLPVKSGQIIPADFLAAYLPL